MTAVGRRFPIWFPILCWLIAVSGLLPPAICPVEAAARQHHLRLRIEWDSPVPQTWKGTLRADRGQFHQPQSLGVDANEQGSVWLEDPHTVKWMRPAARPYDGFDITYHGSSDGQLILNLQSADDPAVHVQHQLAVRELWSLHAQSIAAGDSPRLVVRRVPGDWLAMDLNRDHLVFSPQAEFAAKLTLNFGDTDESSADGSLLWELRHARSSEVIDQGSVSPSKQTVDRPRPAEFPPFASPNSSASFSAVVPLPEKEGPYQLTFLWKTNGVVAHTAVVDLLVCSGKELATAASTEIKWKQVDEFDPARSSWWREVAPRTSWPTWKSSWEKWLSAGLMNRNEPPAVPRDPVRWKAYRLKLDEPGRRHRVIVQFAADHAGSYGVSLLQPDAAGELMPLHLDTGLKIVSTPAQPNSRRKGTFSFVSGGAEPVVRHEVNFWPSVKDPILLIHDFGGGASIDIRQVEVEVAEVSQSPAAATATHTPAPKHRLLGPYMHKPVFPENFGAPTCFDTGSGRCLDDWETFWSAADRMTDYLQSEGYNSLMLAVLADGSSIYPSRLLTPTARYDSGVSFSNGQDRVRKDVLEMLYRMFDSRGWALIPELQFSTTLPELENLIQKNDAVDGLQLVNQRGECWREVHPLRGGSGPIYNPLDPRVQRAVLGVVAELVERYRNHTSFQGVALQLSGNGFLQLPGLQWGYDDCTVRRFEKETGIEVPAGTSADRFQRRHQFLTTDVRVEWLQWRSQQLAAFHERLAAAITKNHPTARCVFTTSRVLQDSNRDGELQAALKLGGKLDDLLRSKGLAFGPYTTWERVTVLRPWRQHYTDDPLERALDETVNNSEYVNQLFNFSLPGCLFEHQPQVHHLAEFDAASPWKNSLTWLASPCQPSGNESRRRFAGAIAQLDAQWIFDGGWMIPLGQEHANCVLRRVITKLPAIALRRSEFEQQPVVVRTAAVGSRTYFCFVNTSTAPVEVTAECAVPSSAVLQPVCTELAKPVLTSATTDDHSSFSLKLEPFGIWAGSTDGLNVQLTDVQVHVPPTELATIEQRVKQLEQRLQWLADKRERRENSVTNAGFEQAANQASSPPGWEISQVEQTAWSLDAEQSHQGKRSLMLQSRDDAIGIRSEALDLSQSRFLTAQLWMRGDRRPIDVRLVFEATFNGRPHQQFAEVQVDTQWRAYRFVVQDIPAEGLTEPRVRVEKRGRGRLWIDDVEVLHHSLSDDEMKQLTKVLSALRFAWNEHRYTDCTRLLESYWSERLRQLPIAAAPAESDAPVEKDRRSWQELLRFSSLERSSR